MLNNTKPKEDIIIIPTKFIRSDGGRLQSKRSRQNNDCSVVALAIAFGLSYDEAYDYLKDLGRECSKGFFLNKLLEEHYKDGNTLLGKTIIKHSFPAEKGKERMNVGRFCMEHEHSTFITRQAKHLATVVDGYLHDHTWNWWRCVYIAYEIRN